MIRPVLTEFALFLAPFAVYAVYLWATREGWVHPEAWSLSSLMWLTIVALALVFGSFLVLAQFAGPAGCTHLNDALRALAEVPALVNRLAAA